MTDQQDRLATLSAGRHYLLATDGSCKRNPGTGGWGVIIQLKEGSEVLRQRALAGQGEVMISTNIEMELTAVLKGLGKLVEPLPVIIISDSRYVVDGATALDKWKAAGWRNSSGAVKNLELWERLDQLRLERELGWLWQRGHVGHALNEMADTLANNGATGGYPRGEASVKKRHPDWFW